MMQVNMFNKIINNDVNKDLGLLKKPKEEAKTPFTQFLTDAIYKTSELEKTSQNYSLKLASGELDNIHEAMIASYKAETSLQYMIEIRNKVLDAYREIMRMQI